MKRLRLFGALDAQRDTRSLPVPHGKPRELLVWLALCAGRKVTRDALANLLYPDAPAARARRGIADALYRLRRTLGEDWFYAEGDTLALDLSDVWVDVLEFETSSESAAALQLYRGDLAEEVDAEWILSDRMRLRDRYLFMVEVECRRLFDAQNYPAVIVMAQHWVTLEPLSEEATCVLMRAFAQLGCFDLALRQFDRLRAELDTDLGQLPCAHTSDLACAIIEARDTRRKCDVSASVAQLRQQALGQPALQLPAPANASAHTPDHHVRTKVQLARADVPLGRPLQGNDYVDVWWTVDAGSEDAALLSQAGMVMLRRHRLRRMIAEAHSQGALPTHADLAQALNVCVRTIARDLATMDTLGTRKSR